MTTIKIGEHKTSQTEFQCGQTKISIETYHCRFPRWQKEAHFDTYGGKAILTYCDEPVFAELYVLRLLEAQGFTGVWVDTYRGKFWNRLPSLTQPLTELPIILQTIYGDIKRRNSNKRKGCWDVLAYKDNIVLFAELKRLNKDSIRQSQVDWLNAAIESGMTKDNFIIVEWDYLQ